MFQPSILNNVCILFSAMLLTTFKKNAEDLRQISFEILIVHNMDINITFSRQNSAQICILGT